MPPTKEFRRIPIMIIMVALVFWGAVLALGPYYYGRELIDLVKALIIFACVLAFLGFWYLLLWFRGRRQAEPKEHRPDRPGSSGPGSSGPGSSGPGSSGPGSSGPAPRD